MRWSMAVVVVVVYGMRCSVRAQFLHIAVSTNRQNVSFVRAVAIHIAYTIIHIYILVLYPAHGMSVIEVLWQMHIQTIISYILVSTII